MAGPSTTGRISELLADPPPGLRIIAPDLPGYGWSGPAPHKWAKEDVASDVLALLDALGLGRVLLVGHDWGGYVGYLMVLRAPERFDGYLALNMGYPWVTARMLLPHVWRFAYQLPLATAGVPVQRYTRYVERVIFGIGSDVDAATAQVYADRFRDPVVGACRYRHLPNVLAARDTSGRKASREAPGDGADSRAFWCPRQGRSSFTRRARDGERR